LLIFEEDCMVYIMLLRVFNHGGISWLTVLSWILKDGRREGKIFT